MPQRLELRQAEAALRADQPDEALRLYARAARAEPRSAEALRGLAQALLEAGAWSRLPRAVEAAVALDPRGEDARLWAAQLLERIEDYDGARRHLRAGVRANPGSVRLNAALARLERWFGEGRRALRCAERAGEPLSRGAALALLGRNVEALSALSGLDDGEALAWRAELSRRAGRAEEARRLLAEAEKRLGPSVAVLVNRALLSLAEDRAPEPDVLRELGGRIPRPLWAERDSAAVRVEPAALEGVLRAMRGNRSGRATYVTGGRLQGHVRFFPRDLLLNLQATLRFGDGDRVLREFDIMLRRRPREIYLHAARGEVCLWLGRENEAEKHLLRARTLGPLRPWPPLGLCALALLRGDTREARRRWEQARANGAPERGLATWLGEVLLLEGRPAEALEALSQAVGEFPFRPAAWLGLVLAKHRSGDVKGARLLYERLRRALPGFLADGDAEAGAAEARRLMRGNRSSWMYTWVGDDGALRHLKLRLPAGARVPPEFQHNPWMFAR